MINPVETLFREDSVSKIGPSLALASRGIVQGNHGKCRVMTYLSAPQAMTHVARIQDSEVRGSGGTAW